MTPVVVPHIDWTPTGNPLVATRRPVWAWRR